eukprot:scaffold22642_cov134-Cylindrotheca_fusiformis.AAC.36
MSALKVNSECLVGLKNFKDVGLIKLAEETSDDTLCSSWPSSSVGFDADGCVTLLDFGGKRLYKGFPTSIESCFASLKHLKKLNLAGTDLPLNDTMSILSIVQDRLECLHIGGNGLRHKGAQELGAWLPSATKLNKLDVRYNDMGGDGITRLCHGLKDHPSLVYFYAEGNQIDDAGVTAIANLLQGQSISIKELFLGSNQIQSDGAKELAASLRSNKILSKLYLEGNAIGLAGANYFSEVLEELAGDTSLKNLFVDNNNIGKEGSQRLAKALNSATAIGDSFLEQ